MPRTTLYNRFYGLTVPHAEAIANTRLKLSTAQEKTLMTYINKLSDRGLPPTPSIMRNIAEELPKSAI